MSSGLYQSKLPIVQSLFPEGQCSTPQSQLDWTQIEPLLKFSFSSSGNPKRSSRPPTSISSNIRTQIQALLLLIKNRRTHYIFCIKPNEYNKTNIFELSLVQHQVRYLSLMPLVKIWRTGHCFNISHANFLQRYKLLNRATWPHYRNGSVIEGIAIIIRGMPLPAAEFMIGITKVFIRSPRTVRIKVKKWFISRPYMIIPMGLGIRDGGVQEMPFE